MRYFLSFADTNVTWYISAKACWYGGSIVPDYIRNTTIDSFDNYIFIF